MDVLTIILSWVVAVVAARIFIGWLVRFVRAECD
jgi:hypothetical protein